jgi:hypothetical protein
MFLEKSGSLCFSKMRPSIYYLLLLVPFFLAAGRLFVEHVSLEEMENSFLTISQKEAAAFGRKARKDRFIKRHANPDPFFLDKQIESFTFLETERQKIESLLHHPALTNKRLLQERLEFIETQNNRFSFSEENIRSSSKIKETEEKQRYPVQMDESDLQRLFTLIEDVPLGINDLSQKMPQLIVCDCRIKKIENALHSEAFEVQMELLKREWMEQEIK